MKTFIIFIVTLMFSFGHMDAQVLTTELNAKFNTLDDTRDIPLSIATPNWTMSMSGTTAEAYQVHSILGFTNGPNTDAAAGRRVDASLWVGTQFNLQSGVFAWKFVLSPGQTTTGGSITADIRFAGTPSTQSTGVFLGVGTTLIPTGSLNNYNTADYTTVGLSSGSSSFGVYSETWNLSVPTGVNSFYVTFNKLGDSAAANIVDSLSVSVTAIPEPSTAVLLIVAFASLSMSRRFRKTA